MSRCLKIADAGSLFHDVTGRNGTFAEPAGLSYSRPMPQGNLFSGTASKLRPFVTPLWFFVLEIVGHEAAYFQFGNHVGKIEKGHRAGGRRSWGRSGVDDYEVVMDKIFASRGR